jgi:hypothetical protein
MKIKLLLLLFFISGFTQSQVSTIFNEVKFGDSLIIVQKKINAISNNTQVITISNPIFPLSKIKEQHLIATLVKLKNGVVKKVVFTFSDDKLSFIQATGNVIKSIASEAKKDPHSFLNYQIYNSGLLYINPKTDIVSFLTTKSLHLNLFTWVNPYLNSNTKANYNASVKVPYFIKMGEELETVLPKIKDNSKFIDVQLLGKKNAIERTQVNGYGIEYAGFPRKFEVRFENNRLSKVWILTGKEEEHRIREKLIQEFGKSIFENENWVVFNNWTVLLRKDKPEIFLITQELGLKYKKQYLK